MELTRAADYAVRVMIHLAAQPPNRRTLLPALARATGAPKSFLSKVLQALCHAGLVESRRGQAGGFEIRERGSKASMREVIEAIDGPIYVNLCVISGASCPRKAFCSAHPFWLKAQEAMLGVLNSAIVGQLAAQPGATQARALSAGSPANGRRAAAKAKPAARTVKKANKKPRKRA
jgi:Rrf2 family protein